MKMEFIEAWEYLSNLEIFKEKDDGFSILGQCFIVYAFSVNPFTGKRDKDCDLREPKIAIDVLVPVKEDGKFTGEKVFNEELNFEGETFEDCVVEFAELVEKEGTEWML